MYVLEYVTHRNNKAVTDEEFVGSKSQRIHTHFCSYTDQIQVTFVPRVLAMLKDVVTQLLELSTQNCP